MSDHNGINEFLERLEGEVDTLVELAPSLSIDDERLYDLLCRLASLLGDVEETEDD